MNSLSTFDITKYPLLDILRDIKSGEIQLPDFQRDWVWEDFQVRRALASVSKAFPIGSMMMLQKGNHPLQFKPRLIENVVLPKPPLPKLLILDGQQRLTTLYMVLLSEQAVVLKDKKNQKISKKWYYLDIEKALAPNVERIEAIMALPESLQQRSSQGKLIDVSSPKQEYEAGLFPLSKVFSFSEWRSEYSKFWRYDAEKLKLLDRFEQEVLKKFEHYQIPVIQLRDSLPKEGVCEVFEDVNTAGCVLNFFDLMSASYCAENFTLRDDWLNREKNFHSSRVLRLVRNTDFVQAVTLVASHARRQEALNAGIAFEKLPGITCRRTDILKLSPGEYQRWADSVRKGFEEAARFLHTQKIFDASDVAYPIQMVALAAIFTVLGKQSSSERVRSQLRPWLWSGMLGEMYTSRHETIAAHDVLEVPLWIEGKGLPTTMTSANFTVQRLRSARKRFGAVYQGLSALLRLSGAIDWSTGEEINDVLYFEQQIESHHIFPVAWCRKQGIDPKYYNCLVNRTPLSAKTNKKIGSKAPSAYLKHFEKEGISPTRLDQMLRSHLINPSTLRRDDFEAFFTARTKALMNLVENAMGKCLTAEPFEFDDNSGMEMEFSFRG